MFTPGKYEEPEICGGEYLHAREKTVKGLGLITRTPMHIYADCALNDALGRLMRSTLCTKFSRFPFTLLELKLASM